MQELYGRRREDGSDPITYTDPADGTVYDWDPEKKAWFPKVWDAISYSTFLYLHCICSLRFFFLYGNCSVEVCIF